MSAFLDQALATLGVSRDALFVVPGNHDVDRTVSAKAWRDLRDAAWNNPTGLSKWLVGGKAPFGFKATWRDAVLARQQAFQDWKCSYFLGRIAVPSRMMLGERHSFTCNGIPIHLILLDSAWLAGDDNDHGKLRLTEFPINRCHQRVVTAAPERACAASDPRAVCAPP